MGLSWDEKVLGGARREHFWAGKRRIRWIRLFGLRFCHYTLQFIYYHYYQRILSRPFVLTFINYQIDFLFVQSSPLQFNIKMFNESISEMEGDCILSPKEIQQGKARSNTIRKIDNQIQKIKSLNNIQSQQYKDFIQKIVFIEEVYKRQNVDLKQALRVMTEKYDSLQTMYCTIKEELQNSYDNKKLTKEVAKLKVMIHNQQNLIDQYRKNIQEEISLQKEFLKSQFQQQKIKLQKQFNKTLMQIQKHYQQKIKKLTHQTKLKQYKVQFKEVKQFLKSRQPSHKYLHKCESGLVKPNHSQYSTSDQRNQHNQPIFLL